MLRWLGLLMSGLVLRFIKRPRMALDLSSACLSLNLNVLKQHRNPFS